MKWKSLEKGTAFMAKYKNKEGWSYRFRNFDRYRKGDSTPIVIYAINNKGNYWKEQHHKKRDLKNPTIVKSIEDVVGYFKSELEKVKRKEKLNLVEQMLWNMEVYAEGGYGRYNDSFIPTQESIESVIEAMTTFSFDYNFAFDDKKIRGSFTVYLEEMENEKKAAEEAKRQEEEQKKKEEEKKAKEEAKKAFADTIIERIGDDIRLEDGVIFVKPEVAGYKVLTHPEKGYKHIASVHVTPYSKDSVKTALLKGYYDSIIAVEKYPDKPDALIFTHTLAETYIAKVFVSQLIMTTHLYKKVEE